MISLIPDSFFRALREFNWRHRPKGASDGGEFAAATGDSQGTGRPPVIKVSNIREALELILAGKTVELKTVHKVYTLIEKLADIAKHAEKQGKKAPNYDLCKVSVAGTNLFCGSKFLTKQHPEGIPRLHMPQLGGEPVPGTMAAQLPKNKKGRVDAGPEFIDYVQRRGIKFSHEQIPAAQLRASQAELIGTKVAEMVTHPKELGGKGPIFVSRDNYVIDGHHRWAAHVGIDAKDGKLGDRLMRVVKIDAPMSELYHMANKWSKRFGIKPVAAVA